MKSEKQFLFSVITAVYNVAEYLEAQIKSIVRQDIGFEENIELILVDDGSTDSSGAIIDKWAARYPENIVALHKENGGVSSARNAGLKIARGKYLNFADADDKIKKNAFRLVADFFASHGGETDVAVIPLKFFEGAHGDHIFNGKFANGTRVIDLEKEPASIHIHANSSFVKREAALSRKFDERIGFSEDTKYLVEVLLARRTLGVVAGTCYFYRRRFAAANQSAIQSKAKRLDWYTDTVNLYYMELIEKCEKLYGEVPAFFQNILGYDIMWRAEETTPPEEVLGEDGAKKYYAALKTILGKIDGSIVISARGFTWRQRLDVLRLKYGESEGIARDGKTLRLAFADGKTANLMWTLAPYLFFARFGFAGLEFKVLITRESELEHLAARPQFALDGVFRDLEGIGREGELYSFGKVHDCWDAFRLRIPYSVFLRKLFGGRVRLKLRTRVDFDGGEFFFAPMEISCKKALVAFERKKSRDVARALLRFWFALRRGVLGPGVRR